ncbi:sigma-70 family RNA polymerase sigma factor [Myxococcaceae bacterium JPH2]|nr:sigma-70 family RNA polymerase sigma factor [Myxococcaceae bacterium JPH2]
MPGPSVELDLEEHRTALTGHCYRMLGSITEAEDAVQETFIRALRHRDQFEGRASPRAWLYRIATNVCLDAMHENSRRARPTEMGAPAVPQDAVLTTLPDSHWVEPVPDALVLPTQSTPAELVMMRQSIRLAFVAALQHLPPRQRAVLLLTEVLEWSAAEVAEALDMTVAAVNSALQRARATLTTRDLSPRTPLSEVQASLVQSYVDAFERYDMEALTALLHHEVSMSMPPNSLWLRGAKDIRDWLVGRGAGCRGSRLVATTASGAPAFGQYRAGGPGGTFTPWSLTVLEIQGDRIIGLNYFRDTPKLFPRFGLPAFLPPEKAGP